MRPVVLCISGLDPSGGAGLQADIESVRAANAHAMVCASAVTVQNSNSVLGFEVIDSQTISAQLTHLQTDMPVNALKTGMLGCTETISVIRQYLMQLHQNGDTLPYVCDPVLVANSGGSLGDPTTLSLAYQSLYPYCTLLTPNTDELVKLTGISDIAQAVEHLHQKGAKAVLVKGGHAATPDRIINTLYVQGSIVSQSTFARLDGQFHGSGCSLASYIAALLAQQVALPMAVQRAELWLHSALAKADRPNPTMGQFIPWR